MQILEPTLIQGNSAPVSVNAAGGGIELDFNFGNQEGALLLAVEYGVALADETSATMEVGLHFDPQAAAPTAVGQMTRDERVFALIQLSILSITAVGVPMIWTPRVDLVALDLKIASNIQLQAFNSGAVARTANVKLYYKRVQFTLAELGGRIAVRR